MCVSNSPANFSKTKGYIGEAKTKKHGLVHVLGYQNKVQNKVSKPNAMILHFPASETMGKENVIDLGEKGKSILDHMCYSIENKSRSLKKSISTNSIKLEIFDTGIYTVVISNKPTLISDALKEVPENKRPDISAELMKWYEDHYPGYSVAVCCFNTKEQVQAEPLFWWYKPMNPNELFFPAIDCHTGSVPNLTEKVEVDHLLTCSVLEFSPETKGLSFLNKKYFMEDHNLDFFQEQFIGTDYSNMFGLTNGDFVISKENVKKGNAAFSRVTPKLQV